MIMMGDKKKMAGAILGPDPKEVESQDAPNEKHMVAKEMINAMKSDDHEGVASCMEAMHALCSGGEAE